MFSSNTSMLYASVVSRLLILVKRYAYGSHKRKYTCTCKHAPQLTMTNTYSYRYKNHQSKTIQQHTTRAKTNTKNKDINSNQWNKKRRSANRNEMDLTISNGIEFHRKGELMKNEHWWKMMMQLLIKDGIWSENQMEWRLFLWRMSWTWAIANRIVWYEVRASWDSGDKKQKI